MGAREKVILLAFLLPFIQALEEPYTLAYECSFDYPLNQFHIKCTGHDDPIRSIENRLDRRSHVRNRVLSHELQQEEGRRMQMVHLQKDDFFLRIEFESGAQLSAYDDRSVHLQEGMIPPSGIKSYSCEIEVGNEIFIRAHGSGILVNTVSYSINGHNTPIDQQDPIEIRIPLGDSSLKIGENRISLCITDTMMTAVMTFRVEVSPVEGGPVEVSCETDYCDEDLTLSVRCTASTAPVTVTCYYDDQQEPCHPCGLEFEIDVTKYTPGPHKVKVEVYDPATDTTSAFWITFTGTAPKPEDDFDLCFVGNTPRVTGGEVYAEFTATRRGLEYTCHLIGYSTLYSIPRHHPEDCTAQIFHNMRLMPGTSADGKYHKNGLLPGKYALKVIARDPEGGEEEEIESVFYVHSRLPGHPYCSVHLINCGWRQEGGSLTVEFASTGLASRDCAEFECCHDNNCKKCYSPFVTDLHPGNNVVKITPLGCGQYFLPWEKTFVIRY